MPPLVLASFRAVFGSLLLSIVARLVLPETPAPDPKERRVLIVLSLMGIVANQILFIVGLSLSTATNATVLVMTIPVFTLAIALMTGAEPFRLRKVLGIPLAAAGVVTLLDLGSLRFGLRGLLGDLFLTLNTVFYSAYLVASRRVLARRPALDFIARVFRYGTFPILIVALPSLAKFDFLSVSAKAWWAVAGIVVLATAATYALNAWALTHTSASTTAFFVFIQPLFATALARIVLGEKPGPATLIGGLFIGAGTILTIWPKRRLGNSPEEPS